MPNHLQHETSPYLLHMPTTRRLVSLECVMPWPGRRPRTSRSCLDRLFGVPLVSRDGARSFENGDRGQMKPRFHQREGRIAKERTGSRQSLHRRGDGDDRQGGCPVLTVFLTPDGRPFFGGPTLSLAPPGTGIPGFPRPRSMSRRAYRERRRRRFEESASMLTASGAAESHLRPNSAGGIHATLGTRRGTT